MVEQMSLASSPYAQVDEFIKSGLTQFLQNHKTL